MQTRTTSLTLSVGVALSLAAPATAQDTYDLRALYEVQSGDGLAHRTESEQHATQRVLFGERVTQDDALVGLARVDLDETVALAEEGEILQSRRTYRRGQLSLVDAEQTPFIQPVEIEDLTVQWVSKEGPQQFEAAEGGPLDPQLALRLLSLQTAPVLSLDDPRLLPEAAVATGDTWQLPWEPLEEFAQWIGAPQDDAAFVTRRGALVEVLEVAGVEVVHVRLELDVDLTKAERDWQIDDDARCTYRLDIWRTADGSSPHRLHHEHVHIINGGKQEQLVSRNEREVSVWSERTPLEGDWALSDQIERPEVFEDR